MTTIPLTCLWVLLISYSYAEEYFHIRRSSRQLHPLLRRMSRCRHVPPRTCRTACRGGRRHQLRPAAAHASRHRLPALSVQRARRLWARTPKIPRYRTPRPAPQRSCWLAGHIQDGAPVLSRAERRAPRLSRRAAARRCPRRPLRIPHSRRIRQHRDAQTMGIICNFILC